MRHIMDKWGGGFEKSSKKAVEIYECRQMKVSRSTFYVQSKLNVVQCTRTSSYIWLPRKINIKSVSYTILRIDFFFIFLNYKCILYIYVLRDKYIYLKKSAKCGWLGGCLLNRSSDLEFIYFYLGKNLTLGRIKPVNKHFFYLFMRRKDTFFFYCGVSVL